jgi:hypothetical protein
MRARALFALVPFTGIVALCACSGTDGGNVFSNPPPEAAPPPSVDNGDGGDFGNFGEAGDEAPAATICTPQGVSGFSPAWTPPEQWKQNVCNATQISGFYSACLTPPISPQACQAFVQQNANCASCLQSQETDSTAAAVVWHDMNRYWSVNVAGCIARATNDPTGTGCGASYAAAIACRQQSCNACWAAMGTVTTFQEFSTCESQAGQSTCQTFASAVPAKCGDLNKGGASVCMPAPGATAKDAYMQVAPLFCGM